jgi:hypothetical protein
MENEVKKKIDEKFDKGDPVYLDKDGCITGKNKTIISELCRTCTNREWCAGQFWSVEKCERWEKEE